MGLLTKNARTKQDVTLSSLHECAETVPVEGVQRCCILWTLKFQMPQHSDGSLKGKCHCSAKPVQCVHWSGMRYCSLGGPDHGRWQMSAKSESPMDPAWMASPLTRPGHTSEGQEDIKFTRLVRLTNFESLPHVLTGNTWLVCRSHRRKTKTSKQTTSPQKMTVPNKNKPQ